MPLWMTQTGWVSPARRTSWHSSSAVACKQVAARTTLPCSSSQATFLRQRECPRAQDESVPRGEITSGASGDPQAAIARAGRLLELFKMLPPNDSGLRAYLVTERARAAKAGDPVDGCFQASATGFFQVAHNEYPGLTCSVIDHDGEAASAEHVVAELLADDEADDVAWRAGVRYVRRIDACTLLDLDRNNLARRAVPRAASHPVDSGRC